MSPSTQFSFVVPFLMLGPASSKARSVWSRLTAVSTKRAAICDHLAPLGRPRR